MKTLESDYIQAVHFIRVLNDILVNIGLRKKMF